jgi:hypothetical protein
VANEIMNKEAKDDGPIKVYDAIRWPLDSKAVKFLLMTESTYSISELKKVKKPLPFQNLSAF